MLSAGTALQQLFGLVFWLGAIFFVLFLIGTFYQDPNPPR